MPHWALDAGVLNRIIALLRRSVEAVGGIDDAAGLRDLARAIAVLERLTRQDRELRYAVDDLGGELIGRITAAVLGAQGADEAPDPAAMSALVEALAYLNGALPPEGG